MTTIKLSTKKGMTMFEKALNNQGTELYEIYKSYSTEKAKALEYCKALCYNENGYNFRIISHTLQGFSVAWDVIDNETGVVSVRIETPYNSYLIA